MSERIFGVVLLTVSIFGIVIGWGLKAPVAYEPVGPAAFPVLVYGLLALCSLALIASKRPVTDWAPAPVLLRIAALFGIVLAYAWLFDRLGFVIATALMSLPVARFFGGSWKQSAIGGLALGVGLYLLFDKLLDVVLPTGLWFKHWLG